MNSISDPIIRVLGLCLGGEDLETADRQLLAQWLDHSPQNTGIYRELVDPVYFEKYLQQVGEYRAKQLE